MKNLAGVDGCDKDIIEELQTAGIPVVRTYGNRSEVPYNYAGKLFSWAFNRSWYYWSVHGGRLPLPIAQRLYELDVEKSIRVAGHCAAPAPEYPWLGYYDTNGVELYKTEKEPPKDSIVWPAYQDAMLGGRYVDDPVAVAAYAYIESYHIDSIEGLCRFADIVRKYEAVCYAQAVVAAEQSREF